MDLGRKMAWGRIKEEMVNWGSCSLELEEKKKGSEIRKYVRLRYEIQRGRNRDRRRVLAKNFTENLYLFGIKI